MSTDTGFEHAACGLLTLDADGVICRANSTFCTWFGYAPDEVKGAYFSRFLTMGGRVFSQTHWAPLMQIQGSVAEIKLSLIHKDGRRLPVLLNAVRQKRDGHTLDELALMVVAERHSYERELLSAQKVAAQALDDIKGEQAARTSAEEQLRLLNIELVQANRFKDDFLATLAHELRNPLAPIRNATEILKKSDPTNLLQARIGGILDRQIGHMTRLVDDLSDISRITQGKIELRRSLVELNEILSTAVDAIRPVMDAAGHEFNVQICSDALLLEADPTRILQAIQNLLNNSAKYTPAGGKIWLTITREDDEVCLSVRDTGIGIAPGELASVFGMFAQLAPGLDRAQGGLGIGLALVQALVELHGGSVTAASAGRGRGSEFTIRLPLTKKQAEPRSPDQTHTLSAPPTTPSRVLIVDDDKDSAESLQIILEMDGHNVVICEDGESALQRVNDFIPDMVLLDIELPGINGYETAKRLRKKLWDERIILVAVTGWGRDQDKQAAVEAGFDHHFLKPIDMDALSALLTW